MISIPYRDGTIDINKKLKYEDEYDVIFCTWNVWLLLLTDWRKLLKAVTELNWLLVQYSADLVLYFWNLQRSEKWKKESKNEGKKEREGDQEEELKACRMVHKSEIDKLKQPMNHFG